MSRYEQPRWNIYNSCIFSECIFMVILDNGVAFYFETKHTKQQYKISKKKMIIFWQNCVLFHINASWSDRDLGTSR